MADHSNSGGGGEVVDHPEDRGGPMGVEPRGQELVEAVIDQGAVAEEGGDGNRDQQEEVVGGEEHRATDETRAMGPNAEPVNSNIVVKKRSSAV
ncbi:hypothetical protein RHMOL_Rhmol01G0187600 [Rhododendron molle]|uniref:Uncharacterized protein n=1 Tax=Rhododendron molle TaxID=49168 RepID=A0ACC0Q4K4_RHOML|nr:hypothetical protein RHMOL_Rhmol01G0187600 [Rhododendron molle]